MRWLSLPLSASPPLSLSLPFSLSLSVCAAGHCNCWPFNKRFRPNSAADDCVVAIATGADTAAQLTCPAACWLSLPPAHHFLTSRGCCCRRCCCFYCRVRDSFVCHCRKLNFKLFSHSSLSVARLDHAYLRPFVALAT